MQHQKAKHFKCNMCPRRLNTAGGLAVHIQQVHKLEPENLPRIENALPGRDGYEVEIFGMEGIPAPDVADYKRRKEIELGLNPGTITQPPPKKPKYENRVLSEEELRAQLQAHKTLMGGNDPSASTTTTADPGANGAVYSATAQTYATPTAPAVPPPGPGAPGMVPPFIPGGPTPGGFGPPMGMPPGPPPPGFPLPPGFPPTLGMPLPSGAPPFMPPPGIVPSFPPPFMPPGAPPLPFPPNMGPSPLGPAPPPQFVPASTGTPPVQTNTTGTPTHSASTPTPSLPIPPLKLPDESLKQALPDFKKPTNLHYTDPNFSPEEKRSRDPKYYFRRESAPTVTAEEPRGKKRARAEDFL